MADTEEMKIKYEKFKDKPLEFLEKVAFYNLVKIDNEEIAAKYIELLIQIQKIKKTMPNLPNQSIVPME